MTRALEGEYNEESCLFDVIGPDFRRRGRLDAYRFFYIVRWKSNRAISRIARRVIQVGGKDLERAVAELAADLRSAKSGHARFVVLSNKWHMRLPMASAILTVLYPDEFTVYDVRVCNQLGRFHHLADRRNIESRWKGYMEYKEAVERSAPPSLTLRDKDRYLWAQSRRKDLVNAITNRFGW